MDLEQTQVRFDRFELVHKMGGGGIADVYKAVDTESNRTVMLRVLSESCSQNPRMQQVYDDLSDPDRRRLEDPNVLRLIACGYTRNRYYFAFEYFDGETLAQRLERERVSVEEGLAILRQVAEGLRGIHQHKVVHGDVKPASVFVGRDKRNQLVAKLSMVDLALAGAEAMVSIYGELVGTPKYMSPEQIDGRHVGPRSDIFSLGVLAYEMFGGREPFKVQSQLGYLRANCEREATPLAALDTSLPIELSNVVQKMMAREPVRRYRNCQSLLDDLDRVESRMAGDPAEVLPPGTDSAFAPKHPLMAPPQPSGAHVVAWGATAAAVLLFATTVGLLWHVLRQPTPAPYAPPPPTVQPAQTGPAPDPAPTRDPAPDPAEPAPPPSDPRAEFDRLRRQSDRDVQSARFATATARYEAFASRHPGSAVAKEAREAVAGVAYQKALWQEETENDLPAAAETLETLLKEHSATPYAREAARRLPRLLSRQAEQRLDEGRFEEAAAWAERLREHDAAAARDFERRLPELLLARAKAALQEGRPGDALAHVEQIAAIAPETNHHAEALELAPRARAQRAQQMLGAGRHREAYEATAELAGQRGAEVNAEALYKWTGELWRSGEQKEALERWDELARRHPASAWVKRGEEELAPLLRLRQEMARAGGPRTDAGVAFLAAQLLGEDENVAEEDYERALANVVRRFPDAPEAGRAEELLADRKRRRAEVALARLGPEDGTGARRIVAALAQAHPDTGAGRWAKRQLAIFDAIPPGMVFVAGGRFRMGISMQRANEIARDLGLPRSIADFYLLPLTPEHEVVLEPFALDRTEVTNAQYERFLRESGQRREPPPSPQWDGARVRRGYEHYPVTHVNYADATAYAEWAGKRLPTEAEWERAARGTDGRLYPWGSDWEPRRANVPGARERREAAPVGSFEGDVSPAGAMDMAGNVREWVQDRWQPYPGSGAPSRLFPAGDRVLRGGAFQLDEDPPQWARFACTAVMRAGLDALAPRERLGTVGFRCAVSVDPAKLPD